jgi:CheY-like chemotaxis protein
LHGGTVHADSRGEGQGATFTVRLLLAPVLAPGGAVKTVDTATPDVLVSDIARPGEDGYALMQRRRTRDGGRGLPALALTAYARDQDRDRALAAGYQLHMTKPADPAELARTVALLANRLRPA